MSLLLAQLEQILLISEHKQKEESWNWNFMIPDIPVSLRSRHRKLYQEAQEDVEQEVHMLRIEAPLQRGKFPWQLQWICMESSNWLSVLVGRWWCIKSAGVSLHCFHMGDDASSFVIFVGSVRNGTNTKSKFKQWQSSCATMATEPAQRGWDSHTSWIIMASPILAPLSGFLDPIFGSLPGWFSPICSF